MPKFFRLGETRTTTGKVTGPNTLADGLAWYVVREEGEAVLYYLTGENPEREERIVLTGAELARLTTCEAGREALVTAIANDRFDKRRGLG